MSIIDLFTKKKSGNIAKDRLKLLLVSERADCSPEIMEMIKNDIIHVISKYMDIDTDGLDIQITKNDIEGEKGTAPALYANIPIKGRKHIDSPKA
ncbi:MAG: cell division topological specificity factor MinE [Lachnospiraceae bacterium]